MDRLVFEGFGGVRLVADAFGSPADPPVLLLPSSGQSRRVWQAAAGALTDAGRYAISLDLRGHGDSDWAADGRYDLEAHVADLRAVLAALSSRAFVIAAGLGAIVAMAAVGEGAPHLVSGLALVDATIWFDTGRAESGALSVRTGEFADPAAILEAIGALYPAEPAPALTERLLAAYEQGEDGRYRWRGDPRALAGSGKLDEERLEQAVRRIAVPTSLFRGTLNETISGETMRRLQGVIPNAEAVEIEGAGHYLASDRDEAFNAVLLEFIERAAPRRPLTYLGGSEPRVLREALGCFGTGVTVVTTVDGEGHPIGLTANSFTSVSLDPPLILFSLAKTSGSLQTFVDAGRFAVNVLHIGQQPVAGQFARRDAPRFESVEWTLQADTGSPIVVGSLASFDCRTYAVHEGGDHLIFIGEVTHAWFEPNRDPLLYFRGKYRRLHFA